MATKASWVMPLAVILSALATGRLRLDVHLSRTAGDRCHGRGRDHHRGGGGRAGGPGDVRRRPGRHREIQLEERRHPGRRIRQRDRLQPHREGSESMRAPTWAAPTGGTRRTRTWIPITDHLGRESNFLGIESWRPIRSTPTKSTWPPEPTQDRGSATAPSCVPNDRGNTWQVIDMPVKMGGQRDGRSMGERLVIDPNLPSVLYFGSRKGGLLKSADAASTWEKVAGFSATDNDKGIGIPVIVFDKASGAKGKATPIVYAAVANNQGSLYRSTDAGATWKLVPASPRA